MGVPPALPVTVHYYGSIAEYHGKIACAQPDWEHPGRYLLRIWDSGHTLRRVRRESIESGGVTVFPGAVCRCGGNHTRWTE
jgi:hypothetical protein